MWCAARCLSLLSSAETHKQSASLQSLSLSSLLLWALVRLQINSCFLLILLLQLPFFFFLFFSELISPQPPRGKRAASPARVCLWLTLLIALAWQNAWLLGLIKDKIRLFFHCVSPQRSCEEKRVKEAQVSLITLATARSAEPCQRPYSCVPLTC